MRIENLRSETADNRTRVAATVIWEDCDRPKQEIFFETDKQFADGLVPNPDAFLAAGVVASLRNGEQRIAVDGEVCPVLRDGLTTVMHWLRYWYDPRRRLVRIEAKTRSHAPVPRTQDRAGFFLSGGIDSLSTLRRNRLEIPATHPRSFKDGILIFGLEVDDSGAFAHVRDYLSVLAEKAAFTLIPISTNARYLDDDWTFWGDEFEVAVLASVAHVLSGRLTDMTIASTYEISYLHPHASHPALDPNYGSANLRIHHDAVALGRFAKTRLVAEWDVGRDHVRVCNQTKHYRAGMLNCGQCEKCVRTMMTFLALDSLHKSKAFPYSDVTEEMVWAAVTPNISMTVYPFYGELMRALEQKGRHDLVRPIKRALALYRSETGVSGVIRRFDRLYLDGALRTLIKAIWSWIPGSKYNYRRRVT